MDFSEYKIGIVGLGYVGLPLAVAFGEKVETFGFDINSDRVAQLRKGVDLTNEVNFREFEAASRLKFTCEAEDLAKCNVYIITVPTPIDEFKRPDLSPLLVASKTIGKLLSPGDIVVYESTVYPGATEEECIPILEKESGLSINVDFYCGYSPERINPGDKERRLKDIVKVTSGSNYESSLVIDEMYKSIIVAGTFMAASIRVAEAAKVIENTQRDINIALINELAVLFDLLDIDTSDVLAAANTKWNFLDFRPGLVGGHCIGVDPYYLTHKAQSVGHHPEVVLAGRRINDSMGKFVANKIVDLMIKKGVQVSNSRILVMGFSFKENCPDFRNTRVIDIVREFKNKDAVVEIYDPYIDHEEAKIEYGVCPVKILKSNAYDAIVVCVAHDEFRKIGINDIRGLGRANHVLFDIKNIFPKEQVDGCL